jgi:hypothetical protein
MALPMAKAPSLASCLGVAGRRAMRNYGEDRQRFRQIVYALKPALQDAPMKIISDEYKSYGSQYGVKGIPHMVIIGRDGRIALVQEGYGEGEIPWLVNRLNKLLAEPAEPSTP